MRPVLKFTEKPDEAVAAPGPIRDDSAVSKRSFNLATAFDRAAFAERTSSPDLSHFVHGSFLKFATHARLPPHDEK